jgi:hypothetical protein
VLSPETTRRADSGRRAAPSGRSSARRRAVARRPSPSRRGKAARAALRLVLDGLAKALLLLLRLSFRLVALALRILTPGIGAGKIAKKAGRVG